MVLGFCGRRLVILVFRDVNLEDSLTHYEGSHFSEAAMLKRFLLIFITSLTSLLALAILSVLQNEIAEQIDIRGTILAILFLTISVVVILNQWMSDRLGLNNTQKSRDKLIEDTSHTIIDDHVTNRSTAIAHAHEYRNILSVIGRQKINLKLLQMQPLYRNSHINLALQVRYDLARMRETNYSGEVVYENLDAKTLWLERTDLLSDILFLIGDLGVGKTLLVSEIVLTSIQRIERAIVSGDNPISEAIPIVVSLSTWKEGDFRKWLVDEIWNIYRVPPQLLAKWLRRHPFQLYLDGYTEAHWINPTRSLQSIKSFVDEYPLLNVVVICRTTHFEDLEVSTVFATYNVVEVKKLSRDQIIQCVSSFGEITNGLNAKLAKDPVLLDTLDSPLLLWLMIEVYSEEKTIRVGVGRKGVRKFREQLIDAYYQRRLAQTNKRNKWGPYATVYLKFLAQQLAKKPRTVFNQIDIQPDWLETPKQRSLYTSIILFVLALPLSVASAIGSAMIGTPLFGLVTLLIGGVPIGVAISLVHDKKTATKHTSRFIGFVWLLTYFVTYLSNFNFYGQLESASAWRISLQATLFLGLLVVLFFSLSLDYILEDGEFNLPRCLGIPYAWAYLLLFLSLIVGGGTEVLMGILVLSDKLLSNKTVLNVRRIETLERTTWSWKNALLGAFWGSLIGLLYAFATGIQYVRAMISSMGTETSIIDQAKLSAQVGGASGFPILIICVFAFSIVKGVEPLMEPPIHLRRNTRERLITKGLELGLFSLVVLFPSIFVLRGIGMSLPASNVLFMRYPTESVGSLRTDVLYFASSSGVWSSIAIGLALAIAFGMLAGISNILIRLLLESSKSLPRDLEDFIDYATHDLVLLQESVGGYQFIHPIIQEHFSKHD